MGDFGSLLSHPAHPFVLSALFPLDHALVSRPSALVFPPSPASVSHPLSPCTLSSAFNSSEKRWAMGLTGRTGPHFH